MDQLSEEIIQNNSILTLQVVAIANNRTAATVVVLEIVKDDLITPVFEKNIYNATYDPIVGVIVENITFIQGFDDTVTMSLEGGKLVISNFECTINIIIAALIKCFEIKQHYFLLILSCFIH